MSSALPIIGGRWQLERRLGAGAMGEVWAARHTVTQQPAAVKLMYAHVGQDQRSVQRFTREVQAASTIDHPGVAAVYDGGRDAEGRLYIAMELLEGESFGDWVRWHTPDLASVLRALIRLLHALEAAHGVGIIHRDIKPDNIFVLEGPADDRPVKLLDFGIARYQEGQQGATQTGLTVGTPNYMSPEQAVDPRKCGPPSDVWSVGVMLYEVLAGRPPFTGETATAVCLAAIQTPHERLDAIAPNAPEGLFDVIDRCLEKRPAGRYPTAAALREALELILADLEGQSSLMPIARLPPREGRATDLAHQPDAREATRTGDIGVSGPRWRPWAIIGVIAAIFGIGTWLLLMDRVEPRDPVAPSSAPSSATPATTRPTPPSEAPRSEAPPSEAPPSEASPSEAPPSEAPPSDAPPSEAPPSEAPPSEAPATQPPRKVIRRAPKSSPRAPATAAPRTKAAPETQSAPETKAAPVTRAAPPSVAAPAIRTAPASVAAPVTRAAPETRAAPVSDAAPATKAAPKTEPFFTF